MMEVVGSTTRKARKPHDCYWCREKIMKGTRYDRWCCIYDGQPGEIKVHQECHEAWQKGMEEDHHQYSEDVEPNEHMRGCLCAAGEGVCVGCSVERF